MHHSPSTLITGGTIVTASDVCTADLFIKEGKIAAIGKNLRDMLTADRMIDATGLYVTPGAIDPHVHLDMPFMGTRSSDDYETGTRAALFGGTTAVIDFILQTQGRPLSEAFDTWNARAEGNAVGDYSFHMAVTDFNDSTRREISQMMERGVTSFKTFMAYKGALMIDDRQMIGLMEEVKRCGGLVTVHATNGDMIDHLVQKHRAEGKLSPLYHYLSQPEITEAEASNRFCDMSFQAKQPGYIVHMTCQGAVDAIRQANMRNQKVYGETCIQYLILDASLYEKGFEGAKWVMSPPLRQKKDQDALWAAINQGTVQVVGTDHCPFTWEQKKMGEQDFSKIPNGHPAIEHRVELLYSEGVAKGKISLSKWVEVLATNPAKIFGMPNKGSLAIGADADVVLFDPKANHTLSAATHHQRCDYSGYEGWQVTGKVKSVFLRGTLAIDNGKCLIQKGFGKYIKREGFAKNL